MSGVASSGARVESGHQHFGRSRAKELGPARFGMRARERFEALAVFAPAKVPLEDAVATAREELIGGGEQDCVTRTGKTPRPRTIAHAERVEQLFLDYILRHDGPA